MFDPTSRKIVVSRDVIFGENKSWKWSNDKIDEEPGRFELTLAGKFGNA